MEWVTCGVIVGRFGDPLLVHGDALVDDLVVDGDVLGDHVVDDGDILEDDFVVKMRDDLLVSVDPIVDNVIVSVVPLEDGLVVGVDIWPKYFGTSIVGSGTTTTSRMRVA